MVDMADLTKEAGEPKEAHEARLGRALPMFDVDRYVADFAATIMPEYRTGQADRGHAADIGLGRSIIPPGTAATRDFSTLAPRIPEFIADACVGCMSCVSACPDSAIFGIAQPDSVLEPAVAQFAAAESDPT